MKALAVFLASFGYVGYFPVAPGTAGSLAGLGVFALIRWMQVPGLELAAIAVVFALGVWAASGTEVALGKKDPGVVVIDEVLGMLVTLALLPVSFSGALLGFLIFRALDVVKPYPAARLEHLHGGMGIMADDAVAGVYSHVLLRLCIWVVPSWLTA